MTFEPEIPLLDRECAEPAELGAGAEVEPEVAALLTPPTPRRPHLPLTAATRHWLVNAPEGATKLYHIGLLMFDRQESRDLDRAASLLALAQSHGLVELTQRRTGPGTCDYLARRTGRPWRELEGC